MGASTQKDRHVSLLRHIILIPSQQRSLLLLLNSASLEEN